MSRYEKSFFSNKVEDIVKSTTNTYKGRYDAKIRLRLNDKKLVVRNLKESDLVSTQTDRDIIHTVTIDEEFRPDLIANKYYGDARLYWVILGANNLREKSQLTQGLLIRIPSKTAVYGTNGLLTR